MMIIIITYHPSRKRLGTTGFSLAQLITLRQWESASLLSSHRSVQAPQDETSQSIRPDVSSTPEREITNRILYMHTSNPSKLYLP